MKPYDLTRPEQVSEALVASLNAGDVDAVMGLYEEGAVFVDLEGDVGGGAIRAAHERFLADGNSLRLDRCAGFEAGDIALVHWAWTVTLRDGSSLQGVSAEVLRRQPDGEWRFVIDNSDGSAVVGGAGSC
jgi:ketosteroid isomerase-like protein